MADKNPYSPIVVPPEWNGRPKNFAMQVKQHISNIYLRLRKKLGKIDSSLATPGNFISIDDEWNLTDSGVKPSDLITGQGVEIPDNSDLDDYTAYGVFYTQNAAHTATLSHAPQTNAGIKLIVSPITGSSYLLQVCIINYSNPDIYLRSYRNGAWAAWERLPDGFCSRSQTNIPSSSDLDSFNTPGVYCVENAAAAATMSHIPYTLSGGRLEVIGQNSNTEYLRQMYYPASTANFYTRIRSGSGWASWATVNLTQV